MIALKELHKPVTKHSNRVGETRNTLVCFENSDGKIVYATGVRVEPHPQTGEVVIVLDSKG